MELLCNVLQSRTAAGFSVHPVSASSRVLEHDLTVATHNAPPPRLTGRLRRFVRQLNMRAVRPAEGGSAHLPDRDPAGGRPRFAIGDDVVPFRELTTARTLTSFHRPLFVPDSLDCYTPVVTFRGQRPPTVVASPPRTPRT